MALEDLLRQRATIYEEDDELDAAGGLVRDEPVASKIDVPCLLRPISASRDADDDRAAETLFATLYFAVDPGVTRTSRIKIGEREFTPSRSIDANSMGRLFAVEVREIE